MQPNYQNSAQQLQTMGRNGDSMLVHMTPDEVGGLQSLAMAMGGSLSINPDTGLPEANILKKLLPVLLGVGLNFALPGAGLVASLGGKAATAGLLVGAGQTALTGDINKGLMAGLGAFGGASLGGALAGKSAAAAAAPSGAATAKTAAANILPGDMLAEQLASKALPIPGDMLAEQLASKALPIPGDMLAEQLASKAAPTVGSLGATAPAAKTGLAGFGQQFGQAARGTMTGLPAKAAPYAAGLGVLDAVNQASMPTMLPLEEEESIYEGPYQAQPRRFRPRESGPGGEVVFFDQVNPYPGFLTREGRTPTGYAEGGQASSRPMTHEQLISTGYTDPATGVQSQLQSSNLSSLIGGRSSLGGVEYIVNDLGKWVPYTAPTATAADTSAPPPTAPPPTAPPPTAPRPQGPPPMIAPPPPPGQTGQTGQAPMGIGARAAAALPELISYFQTSPGPITASRTYAGGSPSERIRRNIAGGANPGPGESDFGFAKSSSLAPNSPVGGPTPMNINDVIRTISGGGGGGGFTGSYDPAMILREDSDSFARGGDVNMKDGSFVVDARTVSEIGNGSSNAGIEHLARMGGRPVRGRGDGVSDSVPARIGRRQEARVARDEVIFSPEAVRRLGAGSHSKGTKKLYALMDRAHKARKKAGRGQDTKVAKGLGGLA